MELILQFLRKNRRPFGLITEVDWQSRRLAGTVLYGPSRNTFRDALIRAGDPRDLYFVIRGRQTFLLDTRVDIEAHGRLREIQSRSPLAPIILEHEHGGHFKDYFRPKEPSIDFVADLIGEPPSIAIERYLRLGSFFSSPTRP